MTIRHWINIVEAKFRQPAVMFHGTTTEFLPTIRKQGIVPHPKKKTWQSDPDLIQGSYSRASLEGSYWTSNLMTAISSASTTRKKFGGKSLIIIAQIAEQSGYADEDSVNFSMRFALEQTNKSIHPGIRSDFLLPLANTLWQEPQGTEAQQAKKQFAQSLHQALAQDPTLHPVDQKFTDQLLNALLLREIAWEARDSPSRLSSWITNIPHPLPSVEEADERLQQLRERLTRTYRKTATDKSQFNQTLRLTQPVGFKGANKILAMLEEQPWEWLPVPGSDDKKLHVLPFVLRYGSVDSIPNEFFSQYETRIGRWPGLVDKDGHELMPSERRG